MIALIVAMFQGSLFVKYLTKFTKEIFSALVSLLYTFEALKKLYKIYAAHPLEKIDNYCDQQDSELMEPNTALLSTILMFGTFMVAYGLRAVKASYFFGRTVTVKHLIDFFENLYVSQLLPSYFRGENSISKLLLTYFQFQIRK